MSGTSTGSDRSLITRKIRSLERGKSWDSSDLEQLKRVCEAAGVSLDPWAKRIAALERTLAVREVMES